MRKIKNPNLKDANFLCCEKRSNLVNKKEICSSCKHLTLAQLKCFKKYKSMRCLSSVTTIACMCDVLQHLCMMSYHVRLFVTNIIYLRLISVIVNKLSVIFVLRYLISLGTRTVTYTMLRQPAPRHV